MTCQECMAQRRLHEESALALAERTIRRLWITTILLIVMLTGVCVGFFIYEAQYEEYSETTEIEADQQGDYNFVAGGDLTYGPESENPEDR